MLKPVSLASLMPAQAQKVTQNPASVLFGASAEVKDCPELGGKGTLFDGVVILDGRRTPFGDYAGSLGKVNETELAITAAKGVLDAAGISPKQISDSIWGNVVQSSSEAAYLARNVMLALGAPTQSVATTINKLCGSGLKAIEAAAKEVGLMKDTSKDYIVLAGGTESMTNAPFSSFAFMRNFMAMAAKLKKAAMTPTPREMATAMVDGDKATAQIKKRVEQRAERSLRQMTEAFYKDLKRMYEGKRPETEDSFRNTLRDGLTHKRVDAAMLDTSENLRERLLLTNEELDAVSVRSQLLADKAIEEGRLAEEIVPVLDKDGKVLLAKDEGVRGRSVKVDSLQKLRAAQRKQGSPHHLHPEKAMHTAANASRIVDGAAAVLVTNVETAERLGKKPLGRIVATAEVGVNPKIMGYGAAQAAKVVLKTAGLKLQDIGLFEVNEAFAGVELAFIKELAREYNMDEKELLDRTNVNGGAIAIGHPLGATGARLPITLLKEMQRRNIRYGLVTACIGGGQGIAMIVENTEYKDLKKVAATQNQTERMRPTQSTVGIKGE